MGQLHRKQCPKCKETKAITEFGIRTKKDPRPRPRCKQCCAEYAKKTTKIKYDYGREVLTRLKRMKGCSCCGYKVHHAALEFNHINREEKLFCIASKVIHLYCKRGTKTKELFRAELNKCEILCSNCHSILSYTENHYSPIDLAKEQRHD